MSLSKLTRNLTIFRGLFFALGFSLVSVATANAAETSFTLAVVPDTQNEVMSSTDPLLPGRYNWLNDNKGLLNLKFIDHTGDVVNWGVVDPIQFTRASNATNILDDSGVPYTLTIGNHDTAAVTTGGSAAPGDVHANLRNTAAFNQTFPVSRFKNVQGTFEAGKVDNMWQTFNAGGVDWLVITHEMWPRQSVIDWMKGVVSSHPSYNVIVSTHAFINYDGSLPTSGNYGDQNALTEYNTFISQYANIKMVLSGHYGPYSGSTGFGYREFTGVNGNKIAAIMTAYHSDFQNHVRLLRIDTASNTISSSVYVNNSKSISYPTGYITDGASNFVTSGMNWVGGTGGGDPQPPVVTAPSAPTNVTATAGDASAVVSFAAPADNGGAAITGYTVTSTPGGITATGTTSPITMNGLTNGVSYTFTVTAHNSAGASPASAPSASVTPVAGTPQAELLSDPGFESGTSGWVAFIVGNLSTVTSPVHSGNRALSISSPQSSNTYVGMTNNDSVTNSVAGQQYTAQCYVRPVSSSKNIQIRMLEYTQNYSSNTNLGTAKYSNIPAGTWTLVKFTGTAVRDGERIIPQIYATNQNSNNGSVLYDDCSFTTGVPAPVLTAPGAPTAVSAVADDGQATVSFSAPADDGGSTITGYTVTSYPGNITVSTSGSPVTVSGLTNGVSYTFTVTATNSVGTSEASAASAAVTPHAPATAPGAPTGLSATAGNAKVSLSWSAPADDGGAAITDYRVNYREAGSSGWLAYNDGVSAGRTATVTGLANDTAYEFTVQAINSAGSSDASDIASATPVAPVITTPGAPTNVTATAGNGSATVSFTAPASDGGSPVTSYIVTSYPGDVTVTGDSSPLTVNGLINGLSYTFTVQAVNAAGTSASSAASGSVTPVAPTNELLPDAGFENGLGGWVAFTAGDLGQVSSPVRSGSKALQVSTTQTSVSDLVGLTHNSVVSDTVAGKTYHFQCYVRPVSSSSLRIQIRLLEYTQNYSSNTKLGNKSVSNVPADTWTLIETSGVALHSGYRMIPQIYATNQVAASGAVLYDDCSLTVD